MRDLANKPSGKPMASSTRTRQSPRAKRREDAREEGLERLWVPVHFELVRAALVSCLRRYSLEFDRRLSKLRTEYAEVRKMTYNEPLTLSLGEIERWPPELNRPSQWLGEKCTVYLAELRLLCWDFGLVNYLWPQLLHDGLRLSVPVPSPLKHHPTLGPFALSRKWMRGKRGGSLPDINRGRGVADCIAQKLADRARTWPEIAAASDLADARGDKVTGKRLASEASRWARYIGVKLPGHPR